MCLLVEGTDQTHLRETEDNARVSDFPMHRETVVDFPTGLETVEVGTLRTVQEMEVVDFRTRLGEVEIGTMERGMAVRVLETIDIRPREVKKMVAVCGVMIAEEKVRGVVEIRNRAAGEDGLIVEVRVIEIKVNLRVTGDQVAEEEQEEVPPIVGDDEVNICEAFWRLCFSFFWF